MTRPAEDASIEMARNRIATLALSMYQIHGFPAPGPDELGIIVKRAEAVMSLNQLRHPDSISASAIGQIDQFVISAAEAKRRPVNIYGADAARPDQSGSGVVGNAGNGSDMLERLRSNAGGGRVREEVAAATGSERSASGARFDDLGSLDWGSPAGLAKMRDYAVQKGIPWAANNPELLRLGPAAVGALAEVHLKQETYKTLTTDAAFKAKDVVTLARFAKEQHVEANALGTAVGTAEKHMTPPEKAKFNGAILPYMADPKNAEKRETAVKACNEATKAHPEASQACSMLKLKSEKLDQANKIAGAKDIKAEASGAKADAKADAFNGLEEHPPTGAKPLKGEAAKQEPKPDPQPARTSAPKMGPPKVAAPKPN